MLMGIILIALTEVARAVPCGWYQSLAEVLDYINGESKMNSSMYLSLPVPDHGYDECLKFLSSQLPSLEFRARINPSPLSCFCQFFF